MGERQLKISDKKEVIAYAEYRLTLLPNDIYEIFNFKAVKPSNNVNVLMKK